MFEHEHRRAPRESMFLFAALRVENEEGTYRVKIRNLSTTGLMAEGEVLLRPSSIVSIEIRNIGWVDGNVAWIKDKQFGVMLAEAIDPKRAHMPV